MPIRVTPDTNVLVSGVLTNRGPAGAIVAAWVEGTIDFVIGPEVLRELKNVLERPRIRERYHVPTDTKEALVGMLQKFSVTVAVRDVPPVVARDPNDDVILAYALSGNADYIVSRDDDLLALSEYRGIPILTPEQFLAILRAPQRDLGGL